MGGFHPSGKKESETQMQLNYTRTEIEQVLQDCQFPRPETETPRSKVLGITQDKLTEDWLELHREVERLQGLMRQLKRRETHG